MAQKERDVAAWARAGQEQTLPGWEELPSIPLYMDQVLYYCNESLAFFQGEMEGGMLTSSMVNNYVKNGVLPHPEKKKYGKEHLATLLMLCLLKQVLPLPDIATLLQGKPLDRETYEAFLQAHTQAVGETCRELLDRQDRREDLRRVALLLAAQANAKRAAAQEILSLLGEEAPKEAKEKKKKSRQE